MSTQANQAVIGIERRLIRFYRISKWTLVALIAAAPIYAYSAYCMPDERCHIGHALGMLIWITLGAFLVFGILFMIYALITYGTYTNPLLKKGVKLLSEDVQKLVSHNHILHGEKGTASAFMSIRVFMNALAVDTAEKKIAFSGNSSGYAPITIPKAEIIGTTVSEESVIHTSTSGSAHAIGNSAVMSSKSTSRKVSSYYLHIRYKNAHGSVSTLVMPFAENEQKAHEFKSTIDIL